MACPTAEMNIRSGSTIAASHNPLNGGFRFLSPENSHSASGPSLPLCAHYSRSRQCGGSPNRTFD
jgi:hypothetical protein